STSEAGQRSAVASAPPSSTTGGPVGAPAVSTHSSTPFAATSRPLTSTWSRPGTPRLYRPGGTAGGGSLRVTQPVAVRPPACTVATSEWCSTACEPSGAANGTDTVATSSPGPGSGGHRQARRHHVDAPQ